MKLLKHIARFYDLFLYKQEIERRNLKIISELQYAQDLLIEASEKRPLMVRALLYINHVKKMREQSDLKKDFYLFKQAK